MHAAILVYLSVQASPVHLRVIVRTGRAAGHHSRDVLVVVGALHCCLWGKDSVAPEIWRPLADGFKGQDESASTFKLWQ